MFFMHLYVFVHVACRIIQHVPLTDKSYELLIIKIVCLSRGSVKPVLGDWQSSYRRCRKDEVVLCRTRIGHSHLTHSYILRKDPPPQCEHCQCTLTVRHILVECNHFARERKYIFRFHPTLIVLFLKQIEFYYKFSIILTVIFYLLHGSLHCVL